MKFWKLSGAGNDFILVEAKSLRGKPARGLAKKLCARRTGIGADGLLVLTRGKAPRLDYFNADGSAAFCGNGSRCGAWWMYKNGWTKRAFKFTTSRGEHDARVLGPNRATVRLPDAHHLKQNLKLKAAGRTWRVDFINTGVPHAVIRVTPGALDKLAVNKFGQALRRHAAFKPAGANVNFAAPGLRRTRLRTYERGVEAETLACGSGAAAAAILSALWRGSHGPIHIETRGGDQLSVSFKQRGERFTDLWLTGPVQLIYAGETQL
jgi:diaminopimelate epimerase